MYLRKVIEPIRDMTQLKKIFTLLFIFFYSFSINAQESNIITHTVNKGQTLYSISKLYGTTVEEIIKINPESITTLSVGQILRIPGNTTEKKNEAIVRKGDDGKLFHTIQSGETLYRLSKLYGITTQEICDANPGLSTSNFRVGETICIPKVVKNTATVTPATQVEENIDNNDYRTGNGISHKVKKGETIYSLAKSYGVEPADIISANPELKKSGLKKKMVINIPVKDNQTADNEYNEDDQTDALHPAITSIPNRKDYNDGVLKVAIVLPFLLDSYAPSEQGRMIEYYQGFLMAVEKLKEAGYSFEINTYDSGPQEKSLNGLLSSGALDNMELIIGAMYPTHNKELAKFAYEKRIPLVIPFTNKDTEIYRNPMVYCVNILQSYLISEVKKHFMASFPNANVIFVENEEEKSNKKEFIAKLTNELDINSVPNRTIPLYNLTTPETTLITLKEFLREDKENIIIPTSSSATTLNTLLPTLQQADMIDSLDIPDYKLFGYPEWQIYAKDTREQMYEVETYFYATFYSHYSIPEITRFQEEYIKRYNCSIQNIYPRYGMLGYDTGYFFLLATTLYGENLSEKINDLEYSPIQTGFLFERLKNGAMINKKINFIHYTPDYRIEKLDFEE